MAAVMLQVIPRFLTKYSKNSLFISANNYENYIVSKEYSIARHDDKVCFLPKWRYHFILIGQNQDLLQKLGAFCSNYQHVDCLYTLFKYRFSDIIVIKSGQLFDNLQRAVHFNQQNRGMDRMPRIAKKRLFRKKYKKNTYWALSERPNQRKLVDQCLQTELNKLKRLNLKQNWEKL